MTSWTKEGECDAMRNMLEQYPEGMVACVSDSYDIFNACKNYWGKELKDKITSRNGRLVVRPDSGDLPGIVTDVLDALAEAFPTTLTSTGHKIFPDYIRVIQGDGISHETLGVILEHVASKGYATDNVVFGSGGALLQKLNRDTQKCAFKCSYAVVNGEGVDVQKDPVTDPGKKSKKGRLTVEKNASGVIETISEGKGDPAKDMLKVVFKNGELVGPDQKLSEIRERADVGLDAKM